MKSKTIDHGSITVLELAGKITIGDGDVQLRQLVDQVLDNGTRKLVIDLGGIKYIDSSGIGELVSCHTTIKNRGGEMRLSRLNSKIYSLLQLTALITVFSIYDSLEDALQNFE